MTVDGFLALIQVILVDLVLAADNAIAVGMAAASLAPDLRRKAIVAGIVAAAAMRVIFAMATVALLKIPGLLLIGGLLLAWVCWKLFTELRRLNQGDTTDGDGKGEEKSFTAAIIQIIVADISMSLDNVLAVAGIARDHVYVLVFGLALAVVLMGVAATFIARILHKHVWIAWVGLLVIVYVSIKMIWEGGHQLLTLATAGAA